MKYKPVTVSVTWIVSSPAVLFTQQRYFPLSSKRAYQTIVDWGKKTKVPFSMQKLKLIRMLSFVEKWFSAEFANSQCTLTSLTTTIIASTIPPTTRVWKFEWWEATKQQLQQLYRKMRSMENGKCFCSLQMKVKSKHKTYKMWVGESSVCMYSWTSLLCCVCKIICSQPRCQLLFKSVEFNYKLLVGWYKKK